MAAPFGKWKDSLRGGVRWVGNIRQRMGESWWGQRRELVSRPDGAMVWEQPVERRGQGSGETTKQDHPKSPHLHQRLQHEHNRQQRQIPITTGMLRCMIRARTLLGPSSFALHRPHLTSILHRSRSPTDLGPSLAWNGAFGRASALHGRAG